jgi:hypothetical protein
VESVQPGDKLYLPVNMKGAAIFFGLSPRFLVRSVKRYQANITKPFWRMLTYAFSSKIMMAFFHALVGLNKSINISNGITAMLNYAIDL